MITHHTQTSTTHKLIIVSTASVDSQRDFDRGETKTITYTETPIINTYDKPITTDEHKHRTRCRLRSLRGSRSLACWRKGCAWRDVAGRRDRTCKVRGDPACHAAGSQSVAGDFLAAFLPCTPASIVHPSK